MSASLLRRAALAFIGGLSGTAAAVTVAAAKDAAPLFPLSSAVKAAAGETPAVSTAAAAVDATPAVVSTDAAVAAAASAAAAPEEPAAAKPELSAIVPLTAEERVKIAKDFAECEQMKDKALSTRKVRFLFENLARIGALVPEPERFVQCVPCDIPVSAAVIHDQDDNIGLVLCQDKKLKQDDINIVIAHELVHVYDLARAEIDPKSCEQLACMEIRASLLSGECSRDEEMRRGVISFLPQMAHLPVCVKRRALNSCRINPHCNGPEQSKEAIERVFARCFQDTAPFYTIP